MMAEKVAETLKIDSVFSDVPPEGKAQTVKEWQKKWGRWPWWATASTMRPRQPPPTWAFRSERHRRAREAAISPCSSSIGLIPFALDLAKRTFKIIRENLFWAFFYNIILIPVAAGVLEPFLNFRFSPLWASAAMAASSVTVVANSLRLRNAGKGLPK
jgi:cation transport ATPase